jgi:hypothetical protein
MQIYFVTPVGHVGAAVVEGEGNVVGAATSASSSGNTETRLL